MKEWRKSGEKAEKIKTQASLGSVLLEAPNLHCTEIFHPKQLTRGLDLLKPCGIIGEQLINRPRYNKGLILKFSSQSAKMQQNVVKNLKRIITRKYCKVIASTQKFKLVRTQTIVFKHSNKRSQSEICSKAWIAMQM